MKIRVLNGPNLNFLGIREKNIYGTLSYEDLIKNLESVYGNDENIDIQFFQSNIEGELINFLQQCYFEKVDGIVLNAGAFTHYSYALNDCIKSIEIPVIEVHISNTYSREEFRHKSVIAGSCVGVISGLGLESYNLAIEYFKKINDTKK